MSTKSELTVQVLQKLQPDLRISYDQAIKAWWQDWRKPSGLRLTLEGRTIFDLVQCESFEFDIPVQVANVPKNLLLLDSKLHCAYYLVLGKKTRLVLYSSEQATVFALLNNADRWMQMLSQA